ncbi:MAG: acylphosphatase [Balneolaceae bacterium]
METVQKHLFLSGRVQGVGFRHYTYKNAVKMGIRGWVRNRNDGRVEAVLQGPGDEVNRIVEKLKSGPPSSSVDKVEVKDEPVDTGQLSFEVIR